MKRPGGGNGHGNGAGNGHGSGLPKPGKARLVVQACPDLMTFFDYLQDLLPAREHERVHAHLWQQRCPSCFKVFSTIYDELLESDEPSRGSEGPSDMWIAAAVKRIEREVGAELFAMVGNPPWAVDSEQRDSEDEAAEGASTMPPRTPVPARQLPVLARPAGNSPRRLLRQLVSRRLVAKGIGVAFVFVIAFGLGSWWSMRGRRDGVATAPSPSSSGTAEVLGGDIDHGLQTIRRAVAAQPGSAELLSDLGGALLSRVEMSDRRRTEDKGVGVWAVDMFFESRDADAPAALEAIDRALEISPRLPEALFNRALALERLYLWRSARRAWQAYLEVDDRSAWAAEARQRLAAIEIPQRPDPARLRAEIAVAAASGEEQRLAALVRSHRELARRTLEEDLLPSWAATWIAGADDDAGRQLHAAEALAAEWESQTGDKTLRAAVDEIETANHADRARLATGYRAFGEASRALDAFSTDAADDAATRALAALPQASRATTWARLVRLACAYYRNEALEPDALRLIEGSNADVASEARTRWILGMWHARRGNLATGLSFLRASVNAYERLDARESLAWLHNLVADTYGYMGASGASWSHRRQALRLRHLLTGNQHGLSVLAGSAALALAEERPHVAVDLLDEALSEPDPDHPDEIAQVCLWRSRVLLELGRSTEARRELDHAAGWLARAKPLEQQLLGGDLSLVAGLLESDPHRAVDRLSRAFERFRKFGSPMRLPGVLLARARAELRAGEVAAADADLRRGLVLLEQQSTARIGEAWIRRLDGPESLFDERIDLTLRAGDADAAFAIAEASHAYSLDMLETGSPRVAGPSRRGLRPEDVRMQLAAGTTLLYYHWLPDRIVLWRFSREGWKFNPLRAQPRELSALIAAFGTDLSAGDWTAETREDAMRLHAALLPGEELGAGPIIVVPDGPLHKVPFAALVNPVSGRFLMEDHEITIAATASAFLSRQALVQPLHDPPHEALVIGDPELDPQLFPGVSPLAGARDEARQVAALYPRRGLLLGGSATRAAFLHSLEHQTVIHFSGHAMQNRVDPALSILPLAEDLDDRKGLLVAADIANLDLSGTRTVVLSGCDTGVGEDGGNGPLSLARAFLVAGVPDVVASLWPIADAPSAPLMTAFHRRLRNGERAAAALRDAQLELLRGPEATLRSPGVWAAFEAFGG